MPGPAAWFAALVALIVGAYHLTDSPLLEAVLFTTATASGALGVVAGIRRHRPARTAPWWLAAAGLGVVAVRDALWFRDELTGDTQFPAPSDVICLVGYGLLVASVLWFARSRSDVPDRSAALDTAIVLTGVSVIGWVLIGQDVMLGSPLGWWARAISVGYPLLSLATLAVLARLAFGAGGRPPAFFLLTAGVVTGTLADIVYWTATTGGGFSIGSGSATFWMAGYGLYGVAALHPSMRQLADPVAQSAKVRMSGPRLGVLWVASTLAPAALLLEFGGHLRAEIGVVAVGSLILATLVVVRMWGLLQTVTVYLRREGEDRFRALVHNSADVIVIVDPTGRVGYVSPSALPVWGYEPHEILADPAALFEPDEVRRYQRIVGELATAGDGATVQVIGRLLHADGGERHFEAVVANHLADPAIGGIVITSRDVTERVALESQLTHQAFHDTLTGLPNRALFTDRVERALRQRQQDDTRPAVLFLDIDDFKTINDSLGHDAGDQLLRMVAHRLSTVIRGADTVARLSGDEFAVLLESCTPDSTVATAARVLDVLAEPVEIAGRIVEPAASLGIAFAAAHGDAAAWLRDADAAMYAAKAQGKGRLQLFDPAMHARAMRRLALKTDLRTAIDDHAIEVAYQPIHRIADDQPVCVEALARWTHSAHGPISPAEFVPLAEETGLINGLGDHVLARACADVAGLNQELGLELSVSVNLSSVQLADPRLPGQVAAVLARTMLPARLLCLELTETVVVGDSIAARATLDTLRELGVQIAIDDFGTGYSSLAYLQDFRFDAIKVDKSFIDPLAEDDTDQHLTWGILELIDSLGVPAVAEGIEHREQLHQLRQAGCAYGQGYLWSKPVPLPELLRHLRARVAGATVV